MKQIKRILVGLDLSEMDSKLIQYSAMLANVMQSETIYFVHISKNLELPESIKKDYPDLLAPMDENIMHEIQTNIDEYWDHKLDCEVKVEVKEGNPADKIIRWTRVKAVDLMIMGKKIALSGTGIIPNKIAKLMQTSMLFVPENAELALERILVPIDFSRFSKQAIEAGLAMKSQCGGAVYLHYSYQVPSGYHKTGKSFDEFAKIMRKHGEADMIKFLKTHGINKDDVEFTLSLDKSGNAAGKIHETALNHKADLIIMSSKGRTGLASVMIGSVTEKLINLIERIPLMIIKDEKQNLSFIDALLKI